MGKLAGMIRHVRPADHAAVRAIQDAAFGRRHEGDIVEHLRADGDIIFELVEEEAGAITGHVAFSTYGPPAITSTPP